MKDIKVNMNYIKVTERGEVVEDSFLKKLSQIKKDIELTDPGYGDEKITIKFDNSWDDVLYIIIDYNQYMHQVKIPIRIGRGDSDNYYEICDPEVVINKIYDALKEMWETYKRIKAEG